MDFPELIASCREELPRFNAAEYPPSFARFESAAAALFASVTDPFSSARDLVSALEEDCRPLSRKEQKERLQQDKLVLTLYLCPAAVRLGGKAPEFAENLNRIWNEKHPGDPFRLGSYENIVHGFEASIFGIPLKNFRRR